MWLPDDIVAAVDRVARIHYIGKLDCQAWNANRREGELRLLTGWCWTAKNGSDFHLGLKTKTVCYRDAWYVLVSKTAAPPITRARLRVVA